MKSRSLQDDILAHLREAGGPESSRDLAARFLKISRADEETCRRLLAPILAALPGVSHRPGEGWVAARRSAPQAVTTPAPDTPTPQETSTAPLLDFVALASDGTGPGGSGAIRVVTLLPVVAGEVCQEESFPEWDVEEGDRHAPALGADDLRGILETIGDLPVVCHRVTREVEPLRRACLSAGLSFRPPVISAAKIGHILLGLKAGHAAVDLAAALGIAVRGPDDCRGRVVLVAESFLRLAARLRERGIDSLGAILEFQEMPAAPVDLSGRAFTAEDLRSLPAAPGVYRFLDRAGTVIYVGKAKNLRARVSSYFVSSARGTEKGQAVLDQAHALRVEPVASEIEAILLEAALIVEHRPRLNRQFDVHERPAPYGPRLNLAVMVRDAGPATSEEAPAGAAGRTWPTTCTVHLLRAGRYLGRVAGLPAGGGEPWERLARRIGRAYFGSAGAGTRAVEDQGIDIDWQLVATYVRTHRDEINCLDFDEAASREQALQRLRVLAHAEIGGAGRVVAR